MLQPLGDSYWFLKQSLDLTPLLRSAEHTTYDVPLSTVARHGAL